MAAVCKPLFDRAARCGIIGFAPIWARIRETKVSFGVVCRGTFRLQLTTSLAYWKETLEDDRYRQVVQRRERATASSEPEAGTDVFVHILHSPRRAAIAP